MASAGNLAFWITWAQLDSLRSLPARGPLPGDPVRHSMLTLMKRGLARAAADGSIEPTALGARVRSALAGLRQPQGLSDPS